MKNKNLILEDLQIPTVEICIYCGEERSGKLGCCGETHFEAVTRLDADDIRNFQFSFKEPEEQ